MMNKKFFRLFALLLICSSPLVFAQSQKLMVWDRDNKLVKNKLEYPQKPEGVTGDWLVVHLSAFPDHLEPYTSTGVYAQRIYGYIFSSLLDRDGWTLEWAMGKDTNSLATSYRVEDLVILKKDKKKLIGTWERTKDGYTLKTSDGKTQTLARQDVFKAQKNVVYTFEIRKDATWHDGKPLTAHDIVFSMDVVKNRHVNAPSYRNYFKDINEWYTMGDYTVRFIYARPYWYALTIMSGLPIIPRHVFNLEKYGKDPRFVANKDPRFGKDYNESDFRQKPIGSGPYIFDRWDSGSQVVIRRNKKYWGRPAYLDKIIWKFYSEDTAALQALKKGEIDFIPGTTTEIFVREATGAEFEEKFVKALYYVPGYSYLGWNMRKVWFKDRRVRQAMTHLMPREELMKTLSYGMGKIVTGPQYFFGPVYDHKLKPWPFDPEKAKKLLFEAGWVDRDGDGIRDKDGVKFEFEILFIEGGGPTKQIAEKFQEELRKVGIKANLLQFKWQAMLHKVHELEFDSVFMGWGSVVEGDPYQIWHSSQTTKKASNHVGYNNPRVDQIIVKGRTIFDTEKRRALYRRMHRIIYFDQPYTFMFMPPRKTLYQSRFRGVRWIKSRPGWDLTEWYVPKELQKYKGD